MNIVVTGGTGFLGSFLCKRLSNDGNNVQILTRNPKENQSDNPLLSYHDYEQTSDLVDGSDAIINLAGQNLFDQKWTDEIKSKILKSRVNTTRNLITAIKVAKKKPSVMISASAVGYYGNRGDKKLTESSTSGNDFLSRVCVQWEEEARHAEKLGVRLVIPRLGILLEKDGGALEKMITPFNLFVGGPLGNGKQYFPWIHIDDTCRILERALRDEKFRGVFNVTAPNPVTMSQFAKELGKVMNRPSLFKVPEFALKFMLGEASGALTASLRVMPHALNEAGFTFNYPHVREALDDIMG